jgi:flagellar biogenesis protein FliO
MNHSAPSTITRRLISFALLIATTASIASTSSTTSAQQLSPPPIEMRRDSAVEPVTFGAAPTASPLTAPPPQLLKLPTGPEAVPAATGIEAAPAVELTQRDGKSPKKLELPGSDRKAGDQAGARGTTGGVAGVFSLLASLGVVLGLFLGAAYLMRRGMPKQGRMLPREAVESLGRIPFPGRQQGQLLRVGNKLVLVSFSSGGASVITEITDPLEVDRLAGMCAQADRHGSVKSFRDVVEQFFGEKPKRPEPPHRNAQQRDLATSRLKEHDVA